MFFFRVKHMRISEKTCRGLTDHTRQLLLMYVSHVMSVDHETSIWEVSRFVFLFLYKVLQRRNDIVTSQTDA